MTALENSWLEANQAHLMRKVTRVREQVEQFASRRSGSLDALVAEGVADGAGADEAREVQQGEHGESFAIDHVCRAFGLSTFERDVLLLCAGMELDCRLSSAVASAQGSTRPIITFSLTLSALRDPHWTALVPGAPLRRFRLVELAAGDLVTQSALRIDERILHFLCGVHHHDERLVGIIEPLTESTALPSSQALVAHHIVQIWTTQGADGPALELVGVDASERRAIAAAASHAAHSMLYRLRAADIPANALERETLARLLARESMLGGGVLLIELETTDTPEVVRAAQSLADRLPGPVLTSARDPLPPRARRCVRFDVERPLVSEQVELWRAALGASAVPLDHPLSRVVSNFNLSGTAIAAASELVRERLAKAQPEAISRVLWDACREEARPRLDSLAQRLTPKAGWDDLILPDAPKEVLMQLVAHVRQRARVFEDWGFSARGSRDRGTAALFAGPSGTGKTMAAEILARELRLDVYRIDLSQVVSKYIGETEKNLSRVFDAAECGGAILLFDEADALFGKRSEVKDSHDRHANIEVGYLLQRMEQYTGLAILTTNLRSSLDTSFLRRLRFIVNFPFPGAEHRQQIWSRAFPKQTPTRDLEPARLSRLSVTGGNIRNIAINAAFLAAEADEPVQMRHLEQAARAEHSKLERVFPEKEWASP